MKKFIRFVFLPIFLTAFLSSSVWAAITNITGIYKAASAKYVVPTLPACQSAPITLTISTQCGRALRGAFTIGTTTILVIGNISTDNTFVYLYGGNPYTGISYLSLYGEYLPATKTIRVLNEQIYLYGSAFSNGVEFADFDLLKQ